MKNENAVVIKNNKVILNLIQDLQRLPLQLVNNLRGRSRIKYGMTSLYNNGGFTLIELLVVVLIIGILAAVAVPQYQKAVTKSRLATLKNLTKSIADAQEVYYLENGKYATTFNDLVIQAPTDGELNDSKDTYAYDWGRCVVTEIVTACSNTKANISYQKYYHYITSSSAGQTKCLSRNNVTESVCLQETKDNNPIDYGTYKVYIYQ